MGSPQILYLLLVVFSSQACLRSLLRQMAELTTKQHFSHVMHWLFWALGILVLAGKKPGRVLLAWTKLDTAESAATGDSPVRGVLDSPYLWQGQCLHQASDSQAKRQQWPGGLLSPALFQPSHTIRGQDSLCTG